MHAHRLKTLSLLHAAYSGFGHDATVQLKRDSLCNDCMDRCDVIRSMHPVTSRGVHTDCSR